MLTAGSQARSFRRIVAAATTTVAVAAVSAVMPGVASAATPFPVTLVSHDGPDFIDVVNVSSGGRHMIISDPDSTDRFHVTMSTGTTVLIPASVSAETLSHSGRFVAGLSGDGDISWFDVKTGRSGVSVPPLTDGWGVSAVDAIADDGDTLALFVVNGNLGQVAGAIYERGSNTIATPLPNGVAQSTINNSVWRMSADGRVVTYDEYEFAGGQVDRSIEWNRSTDTRRVVERPADHDVFGLGWSIAADLTWEMYQSDDEVRVRRVGSTTSSVVPVAPGELTDYWIQRGGRLVYTTQDVNGANQLYTWAPGESAGTLVSAATDGSDSEFGIDGWSVSDDGRYVTFTSFSADIVDNNDGEAGIDRFVYQAQIPTRVAQPIPADGRICATARGADPGDFVGVNLTPLLASAPGFGTVHPNNAPIGDVSNVNFGPGTVDPNVAFVEVAADGRFCFANSLHGPVDVILDQLIVGAGATFAPPSADGAVRVVDTRDGVGGVRLAASEERCFAVTGDPGDHAFVNVTPLLAAAPGFGTVHSSDDAAGDTSNVNFAPGSVDPNLAFAAIGSDGRICFTNSVHGAVDVIVDQLLVADGSAFALPSATGAVRLADTRDGIGGSALTPNEVRCLAATGASPGQWVGVNATPVLATAPGFGTLHSSDNPAGGTSNVNFGPGTVDPNVAFVEVGTDGRICFTNSEHGTVELVLDLMIVGEPTVLSSPTAAGSIRLVDTREPV